MKSQAASVSSSIAAGRTVIGQALWIMLFTVLTAFGGQIEFPHQPVPYTMQTFFVLLSGAILGMRGGFASQALYLAAGVLGVPVFSGWGFGFARLVGPTGGYLLSFPIAAFAVGYLIRQHNGFLWSLLSMATGLLIIFSLGTVQLHFVYVHNWSEAVKNGFLIFSWWDAAKLVAAASLYRQIRSQL